MRKTRRADDDFGREVQAHIALETDHLIAEGLEPSDAREAAARSFGNVTGARERFYESTRIGWLEDARRDLRYAWRALVRAPGFALVAIVSIAIGVGANAAMFSVADGLLLRPLPVPQPGDVVTVSATTPGIGLRNPRLSLPDYLDVRDQARSFDGLVAYRFVITGFASRPGEPAERIVGMAVSGNLFEAMRVRPTLGRAFRPDEDAVTGRDAVVILDHDEWQRRFAGDPQIVDRRIHLAGVEFTVIGVAPEGFTGIDQAVHPAFYVPLAMFPAIQNGVPPDQPARRDARGLVVKGRLKPGITMTQARLDVERIGANLSASYPDTNTNQGLSVRTELDTRTSGPGEIDSMLVTMLMTLALVVLVVACANVAGLLTSRAPARTREIALRLAIGAGRGRLVRQLITESLLLAVAGGALGLLVAYGAIATFQRLELPTDIPLKLTFELDRRVLVFGLIVAGLSAVLSSLIPAWRATRTDLVLSLKDPGGASDRRTRIWGRSTLVCGQVALALVLLTVSLFLYRTFQAELGRGPGYRTDHVLMMAFDPGLVRYDGPRTSEFYRRLKEGAAGVAGVRSLALTSSVPMKADTFDLEPIAPEGFLFPAGTENVGVLAARVDEDYFDTLGIGVVRGRGFLATDTAETPRVAVVNETLARRYWPQQDAIGRRVRLDDQDRVFAEIVGIAADSKYVWIGEGPTEFIYLPRLQAPAPASTLLVRSDGDPATMASALRAVVRGIDPSMPVFGVRTMEDLYFSRAVHTTNLIVGSIAGMGSMGLLLAVVGLYGLVSYSAGRRTREIGVRMAVGADPTSVSRMVLRHGLVLAICGVAIGVGASAFAGRLLRTVFPSTAGMDLIVYLVTVPALVAVTLLAAYIPARRAARMDPLIALRCE